MFWIGKEEYVSLHSELEKLKKDLTEPVYNSLVEYADKLPDQMFDSFTKKVKHGKPTQYSDTVRAFCAH